MRLRFFAKSHVANAGPMSWRTVATHAARACLRALGWKNAGWPLAQTSDLAQTGSAEDTLELGNTIIIKHKAYAEALDMRHSLQTLQGGPWTLVRKAEASALLLFRRNCTYGHY